MKHVGKVVTTAYNFTHDPKVMQTVRRDLGMLITAAARTKAAAAPNYAEGALKVGSKTAAAAVSAPLSASAPAAVPIPQACATPSTCVVPTYKPLQPNFPSTYQMNLSTMVMPCNAEDVDGGWSNASFFGSFGIAVRTT